jgi:hypothetical protein
MLLPTTKNKKLRNQIGCVNQPDMVQSLAVAVTVCGVSVGHLYNIQEYDIV